MIVALPIEGRQVLELGGSGVSLKNRSREQTFLIWVTSQGPEPVALELKATVSLTSYAQRMLPRLTEVPRRTRPPYRDQPTAPVDASPPDQAPATSTGFGRGRATLCPREGSGHESCPGRSNAMIFVHGLQASRGYRGHRDAVRTMSMAQKSPVGIRSPG